MRWRLQLWYGALLVAVLAGFGLTAYEYQRLQLLRSTDQELERRAGAWARALRSPANTTGRPDSPLFEPTGAAAEAIRPPEEKRGRLGAPEFNIADDFPDGSWYAVRWLDKGERRLASPAAPADVPRPQRAEMKPAGPTLRVRGDFREAVLHLGPGDYLVTGRDLSRASEEIDRFGWMLAGMAALILALGLGIGAWIAGRSLRPLATIGATAREIAGGDLARRVPTTGMDREVALLADVLNESFARLEEALARQKRFTADAAHELRTPVAIVLMQAQDALAVPGGEPAHREALEACERAGRRMRSLTEALLRLARLDAGGSPGARQTVDLAERARESDPLFAPLARKHGVELVWSLAPAPCIGDASALDQLVANLLTNAIVHGGGRVEIATSTQDGGALLEVCDAGAGLPADKLEQLFVRFGRFDASRSRGTGGVGLGLAICKAIVEAHHGRITATNRAAGGAVFSVWLPGHAG